MSRRTEIRDEPYSSRKVEWEFDTCKTCRTEISRNRYVSTSARHTFTNWWHVVGGRRECVFYATPEDET